MKSALHPMMLAPIAMYVAFVSLSLLDVEILYFVWPYPLLLSLKKWVSPGSIGSYTGGWTLGLVLVSIWAWLMLRILERPGARRVTVLVMILLVSVAAWSIPLQLALRFDAAYGVTSITELLVLGALLYLLSAVALVGWSRVKALGVLATSTALVSWYVPLLALQATTWGIALAAGWPVGE